MDFVDFFWHLAGFLLPAAALAAGMVLLSRVRGRGSPAALRWPAQLAIHFGVGVAVLVAGLVLSGRDGRLLTYAALVLVSATTQTLLARRRR